MKKYLVLLTALIGVVTAFIIVLPFGTLNAKESGQGIDKANQYFKDRLYSKAIEAYKPFLENKNGNLRYEAELKTALAYNYQNKFDEALKQIYSYKVPKDNLWKARYYFVKYSFLGNSPYRHSQYTESDSDPSRFTPAQLEEEQDQTLKELWSMRKNLINMPLEDSKDYLPSNHDDYFYNDIPQTKFAQKIELLTPYHDDYFYNDIPQTAKYPTLFDYAVPMFANTVLPEEQVYEQAYKLKGADRAAAAELWHIRRINLLAPNTEETLETKAEWMKYIAGQTNTYPEEYGIKNYIFKAKETMPKAQAAYIAASLLNDLRMYEESMDTLAYCLNLDLNTISKDCERLKEAITAPIVSFGKNISTAAPQQEYNLEVVSRNIKKFYVHIFKVNIEDFKTKNGEYNFDTYSLFLEDKLKKPIRTLGMAVAYDQKYAEHTSVVTLPKEESGYYVILLDKDKLYNPKTNLWKEHILVNFTNIALVGTAYAKPKNIAEKTSLGNFYNIYSLDPKTGAPVADVKIQAKTLKNASTGKEGLFSLPLPEKRGFYSVLGVKNGNYAPLNIAHFNKEKQTKYLLNVNTDMAVYNAGATIKTLVTAAEFKGAAGYILAEGKEAEISLFSPNGTILEKKTLKLDANGSAEYKYKIDKDALLGRYYLHAKIADNVGDAYINVEAFKAPEFEVSLQKNTSAVKFDMPFNVNGSARYYTGLPAAGAKVIYNVEQSNFYPIFWRNERHYSPSTDVASGETFANDNGEFKLTFTPKQAEASVLGNFFPVRYTVSVSVTDMAGNTINAQEDYIVGGKKEFFTVETPRNFFRQDEQNTVEVKMLNINGELLEGKAKVNLYAAKAPNSIQIKDEYAEKDEKESPLNTDTLIFQKDEPTTFNLPALKEGWYKLEFLPDGEKQAAEENSYTFMVVNIEKPAIDLPNNTNVITEFKTYYPGEKAVMLVGSSKTKGNKYVEIYKDRFLVGKKTLSQEGIAVTELPITSLYQGGLEVKWFSVYDYNFYNGETSIEVPYVNSKLILELSGTEYSEPGTKKTIQLTVSDEKKNPVDARAIITVYDKALDYYMPHSLNAINAFKANITGNPITSSLGRDYAYTSGAVYSYSAYGTKDMLSAVPARARGAVFNDMADDSFYLSKQTYGTVDYEEAVDDADGGDTTAKIRYNFTSNAFWQPNLPVKKGKAEFTFTLPQNTGKWNVLAAAFTKNVKTGKTSFAFVSKKDFMLNLEAPRFLRTGDKIEIPVILSNSTNAPMTAEVLLTVNQNCSAQTDKCEVLEYPAKNVTIPAMKQITVKWAYDVPQEGEDIMFSASAKSANLSDGEIKTVSLLPSAQQLTASKTVSVKKGSNRLALDIPQNAALESVHITISPSLLIPVLNAMPLLVKANTTSATYAANAYFPLAIFSKLYNENPQLKEAAAKLKRNSVLPAWNSNEELLLNNPAQTPWYMLSKNYNAQAAVINLFDAKTVETQKNKIEKELAQFQNKDGGYAWVKGGKSSLFITLNVLESFAQANNYGVKIDEEAAKKALEYVYKETKLPEEGMFTTPLDIYSAYILTSFPKKWNAKSYDLAAETMKIFEKEPLQKPLSYAYAAMIYKRLGDEEKANLQIERLFDTAQNDDIIGISWSPEARSWQWFEDGITLHTAALSALNEVAPEDERIEGLTKWLIFNEKAQAWGDPQSAAKAVFSLMGMMMQKKALEQTKLFTTDWNDKTAKVTVQPFDLDPKGLTISAYKGELTAQALKASITKSVLSEDGNAEDIEDYATMTALFTADNPQDSSKGGLIKVEKNYYLIKNGKALQLKGGEQLEAGDQINVRLTLNCTSAFDFVVLSDQKPAAFENDELLSGWKYDELLPRYEELKANVTNFYLPSLPKGVYELNYTIRPSAAGTFSTGAATAQSMYMPEITAHSAGYKLKVK